MSDQKAITSSGQFYNAAVHYLLNHMPFYGYLYIKMNKIVSKNIPIAGVNVSNNRINLYLNPDKFEQLDVMTQVRVLQHELLHVVHNHMARGKNFDHKMFNKAADLAINQLINGFPDSYVVDGKPAEFFTLNNMRKWMPGVDIKEYETAEYYYTLMQENGGSDKWGQKSCDGSGHSKDGSGEPCPDCKGELVDDHDGWGKDGSQDPTVAKEMVKDAINEAKRYYEKRSEQDSSIGKLPQEVLRMIEKLNANQVDWKRQLRGIIANSEEIIVETTRKRRNRRFGFKTPGDKKESLLKIGVIMDVSGSTHCGSILNAFVAELHAMQKQGAVIDVVQVDTEVHAIERFNPKKQFEIKGGGGTDMNPGIVACKKLSPDLIICLTDGYIPEVHVNPGCTFVWCVIENKEWVKPFGKKIDIDAVAA